MNSMKASFDWKGAVISALLGTRNLPILLVLTSDKPNPRHWCCWSGKSVQNPAMSLDFPTLSQLPADHVFICRSTQHHHRADGTCNPRPGQDPSDCFRPTGHMAASSTGAKGVR
jgi:hypothetical protein